MFCNNLPIGSGCHHHRKREHVPGEVERESPFANQLCEKLGRQPAGLKAVDEADSGNVFPGQPGRIEEAEFDIVAEPRLGTSGQDSDFSQWQRF